MKHTFEILAPAGSFEILKAVVSAGADAVYVGGNRFGARAYANNFSDEELLKAIDYCHLRGVKLYMTVNTLMKGRELEEELVEYLSPFYKQGLDAAIVQDLGAMTVLHRAFPDLELHASTQMTIHGLEGALLMKELGATRIVTSREMSLSEIQTIHENLDIEIETFVHGALCYCYSGQCLFSSLLGGRSGNRGRCAQPCRLPYSVLNQEKKMISKESYVLSLKDNCAIGFMKEMDEAGIYSLKIEGRMKQAEYAAGVVSFYRKYVDAYLEKAETRVTPKDMQEISDLGNRSGFTNKYFTEHNGKDMLTLSKPSHSKGNDSLQARIRNTYVEKKDLLPISCFVEAKIGQPLKLTFLYQDITITREGQEVLAAEKRPIEKADIEKAIGKLGDDDFYVSDLEIILDSSAFLPVNAMKSLRRESLEYLKTILIAEHRREMVESKQSFYTKKVSFPAKDIQYIASMERREYLATAVDSSKISVVYMDAIAYEREHLLRDLKEDLAFAHKNNKQFGFMLPMIFRKESAAYYASISKELKELKLDYLVVRNYEELYWVKKEGFDTSIITDQNLYTYNNTAEEAFHQLGASYTTVPYELNGKEIAHRNNGNSEMVLYGAYPLMVTANCVMRTCLGCKKQNGLLYLQDRYQKLFPVKNCCDDCLNIIYNSLPTNLMEIQDMLEKNEITRFRVHFTTESIKEAKEVLNALGQGGKLSFETTKGHYKRGVE